MARFFLVGWLLFCIVFAPGPAVARFPPPACLAQGRQQVDKAPATAIATFEACVGAETYSYRDELYSEIAAAAFQMKNLDKAEQAARTATVEYNIYIPSWPQAAAFYTLGRILESRGDKPGAIAAYKKSLTMRFDSGVRQRLATLDAAAAASLLPFTIKPLERVPFPSLAAFCKANPCQCSPAAGGVLRKPPAPYQEVKLLSLKCGSGDAREDKYVLGVKMDGLWYSVALTTELHNDRTCESSFALRSLATKAVIPGGAPVIVLDYDRTENSYRSIQEGHFTQTRLLVGVGPSHLPSSTEIELAKVSKDLSYDDKTADKIYVSRHYNISYTPDGSLSIKGPHITETLPLNFP